MGSVSLRNPYSGFTTHGKAAKLVRKATCSIALPTATKWVEHHQGGSMLSIVCFIFIPRHIGQA